MFPVYRALLALLCLALSHMMVQAQQVELVTVRSAGDGATPAEAIREALVRAVAQINGEALASQVRMQISSSESSNGERSLTRKTDETFNSVTRGVVRSHQILKLEADKATGLQSALIEASIASFRPSEQLKRIRVAVTRDLSAGKPAGPIDDDFARRFSDGLSENLIGSRKVAVLTREDALVIEQELLRLRAPGTAIIERARIGNLAAPDLLVVYSVRKLSVERPRINVSGDANAQRLSVIVTVKVLDYTSGMIKHSVTVTGSRRHSESAAAALALELGREAADKLIEHAFPALVIGIDGVELTLSLGETYLSKGDKVALFTSGKELKDPDTGESMGFSESPLGEGIVTRTTTRFSVVRVTGDLARQALAQPANSIVGRRLTADISKAPMPALPKPASAPKEGRDW